MFSIAIFLCFCSYLKGNGSGIESDSYYLAVVEGITANTAKLKCGVLVWDETVRRLGNEGKLDTSGNYNMWWNGEKIATRYKNTVLAREDSQYVVKEYGIAKAYNGKEYREMLNIDKPKDIAISKKIHFTNNDDFLRLAGLTGEKTHLKTLEFNVEFCKKNDACYMKWESVEIENNVYIKCSGGDKSTGRYEENIYDPSKGFNLISTNKYASSGKISFVQTNQYVLVAGNAWLPVQLDFKYYRPDTGELQITKAYKVNMKKSSFNDTSLIKDEVFELEITNDMEISDYRSSVRINYEKDIAPLEMEELVQLVEAEEDDMAEVENNKSEVNKEIIATSQSHVKPVSSIELELKSSRKKQIPLIIFGSVIVVVSIVFFLVKRNARKGN